jgi:hypothetical protein
VIGRHLDLNDLDAVRVLDPYLDQSQRLGHVVDQYADQMRVASETGDY